MNNKIVYNQDITIKVTKVTRCQIWTKCRVIERFPSKLRMKLLTYQFSQERNDCHLFSILEDRSVRAALLTKLSKDTVENYSQDTGGNLLWRSYWKTHLPIWKMSLSSQWLFQKVTLIVLDSWLQNNFVIYTCLYFMPHREFILRTRVDYVPRITMGCLIKVSGY